MGGWEDAHYMQVLMLFVRALRTHDSGISRGHGTRLPDIKGVNHT